MDKKNYNFVDYKNNKYFTTVNIRNLTKTKIKKFIRKILN